MLFPSTVCPPCMGNFPDLTDRPAAGNIACMFPAPRIVALPLSRLSCPAS